MTQKFKSFGLLIAFTAGSAAGSSPAGNSSLISSSVKAKSSVHFKINSISEFINSLS